MRFARVLTRNAVLEDWCRQCHSRVNLWVGLKHQYCATGDKYHDFIELANNDDTGFHARSNEAEIEQKEMNRRSGKRCVNALWELGYFELRRPLRAHCVSLDDGKKGPDRHQSLARAIQPHPPTSSLNMRPPVPETLTGIGPELGS